MLYDTLKSLLGSSKVLNLADVAKLQRQAEIMEEIETELEDLESQLAEWEQVCGVYDNEEEVA